MSFLAWDVPTILVVILLLFILIVILDKWFPKSASTKKKKEKTLFYNQLKKVIYFMAFLKTHKTENLKNKRKIAQWFVSLYPVLLLVLLLRSFIAEPFQIPSNSMMPTLLTGDFILVNKFAYGIRLPVTNTKIININQPKYGDILVFRYPNYEQDKNKKGVDYIKRVIGTPGDKVIYKDDELWINDNPVNYQNKAKYIGVESGVKMTGFKHKVANLNNVKHDILLHPRHHSKGYSPCSNNLLNAIQQQPVLEFYPDTTHCSSHYQMIVPDGYYLVMGDNRSASSDGRFWGFVPESMIIGQAFFIWMHFDQSFKFDRLGVID